MPLERCGQVDRSFHLHNVTNIDPSQARQTFSVSFYLVSIMYLLFDIEICYLFPYVMCHANAQVMMQVDLSMRHLSILNAPLSLADVLDYEPVFVSAGGGLCVRVGSGCA
jgi:hypothetical protein